MRLLAAGLVLLVHAAPARALTVADCQAWLVQVSHETAGLPLARAEHTLLVRDLDDATRTTTHPSLDASIASMTRFQQRAASLARDGKLSPTAGERLKNLSETVRRCLARVRQEN